MNRSKQGLKRMRKREKENVRIGIIEFTSVARKNKIHAGETKIMIDSTKIGSEEAAATLIIAAIEGGKIHVRQEIISTKNNIGVKNPDYEVNNKFCDLKTIESYTVPNGIKRAVKIKARQLAKNPGNVYIDITKSNVPSHIARKKTIDGLRDNKVENYGAILYEKKRRRPRIVGAFKKMR